MDLTPLQLSEQCQAWALELSDKCLVVASYEVKNKEALLELKRAQAKATLAIKGTAQPSVIKIMIENDTGVRETADKQLAAEALLIIGKAELDGIEAKFQAAKQCLQLKIQEMRNGV